MTLILVIVFLQVCEIHRVIAGKCRVPLHLVCEEDVTQFLASKRSLRVLDSRTLAELCLVAGYLEVLGVVSLNKGVCVELIYGCWHEEIGLYEAMPRLSVSGGAETRPSWDSSHWFGVPGWGLWFVYPTTVAVHFSAWYPWG